MTAAALFPDCVIPGCPNPVPSIGEPCGECLRAFGPMLRHTAGAGRLTETEIAERDRYVRSAYTAQRAAMGGRI